MTGDRFDEVIAKDLPSFLVANDRLGEGRLENRGPAGPCGASHFSLKRAFKIEVRVSGKH